MDNTLILSDLLELATHLRQERLFVISERAHLQELNEKVTFASSRLAQSTWILFQQRVNLNKLVMSRPDCTPSMCCKRADSLESTKFVDAYKILGYQEAIMYGHFLNCLRSSPELLASCLVAGEQLLPEAMAQVIQSLVAGLYGSCILPEDKLIVLQLLRHLTEMQMVPSDDPRRLLRHGSGAFSLLYSSFHAGLFSAKLFLTAALHDPIMQLLMEDEKYLDIDPDKAAVRFSPEERFKKFGQEGTPEYAANLQKYRNWTISCLVTTTKRFISSLHENMHCFPTSVCWLVRQISSLLTKGGNVEEEEVFAIITDLVFSNFICPAIVNPEPYGITDAPIGSIARFNLIQVAQILQMLAMRRYKAGDPKVEDLYSQFGKECVSAILDQMLEGIQTENKNEEASVADNRIKEISRTAALFTEAELHNLVTFLRTVANGQTETGGKLDHKKLTDLLSQVPAHSENGHTKNIKKPSPNKVSHKGRNSLTNGDTPDESNGEEENMNKPVLAILFDPNSEACVGLLSEQKILSGTLITDDNRMNGIVNRESQEKRARFSVSQDDGSIGNVSDNLEAVSEGASNRSVASSLEMETEDQNDNLSDMVSANVSGRGSPNISGRDTPSSQITEGEETNQNVEVVVQQQELEFAAETNKSDLSRFDIDDKFGKFQIKKLIEGADETISLVSDTWSTDVLGSDSETLEQLPQPPGPPGPPLQILQGPQLLDVSETASEAWSTDVVASDSERMTEVDTDDTASVARSDDTARSEFESRGDLEADDTPIGQGNSTFRPIREENFTRPIIPPSPTRVELMSGLSQSANVTGRGGAQSDYRRQTIEYVDSNRRSYARIGASLGLEDLTRNQTSEKPPELKPALVATTHAIINTLGPATSSPTHPNVPTSMFTQSLPTIPSSSTSTQLKPNQLKTIQNLNQEVTIEDSEMATRIASVGVCLSNTSLASTSSSASSSESRPKPPDLSLPATPLVLNGSVVLSESSSSTVPKPQTSTGAIPKSISFDKTAERGDKESLDEDGKQKRNFFRNFKLPFKSRRGKSSFRGMDDIGRCIEPGGDNETMGALRIRRNLSEESRPVQNDTSDEILAKYRRKSAVVDSRSLSGDGSKGNKPGNNIELPVAGSFVDDDERLTIDPTRVETSYAFGDAKKKLRLVLSTAEMQQVPDGLPTLRNAWSQKENELVAFLQLQLAEAINLQDRALIAHLHETLRCVRLFDSQGCRKLFESIKDDYKSRAPYVAYLVRYGQSLLSTQAHLERLIERVKCDRTVCSAFLIAVCVRLFLEKRETLINEFTTEFQQLTLPDEKNDLLDKFLHKLSVDMDRDSIWQASSVNQLEDARTAVERAVISRVYIYAMYPNGDADINRDQVLHEHMKKLAKIITPNHKDLRIPKIFHYECPWPSAQAEIVAISAYKTPRDKLQCVFRCCTTIMNLLSLAFDSGVPAADDLVPVLVYVILKANPPSLLSTVQYVSSFYANRLEGEQHYWWIQFCAAIEFIKTMD
uniref:Receptor-mediated endocytosis protein 6 homolog n=1 Tax=Clastoptera arizonana TaxID=38151 RepID=A0A1B6E0D7_9HEMI